MDEVATAFGRICGACSMCCKLMGITELQKPGGAWCGHVRKGQGCAIYEARPNSCREFWCGYLTWPNAGEHWLPSKCKMVMVPGENRMAIHVDPDTPNVWKTEPYYSDLKDWACQAAELEGQLVVSIAQRLIAILPDGEIDLGFVGEDDVIFTGRRPDGTYGARTFKADDPRIQGMEGGKPFIEGLEF